MSRKTKRKPGPVPGTTGAGRTERLHVRVTPAEHAAYTAYAARWGLGVSEWARDVLSAQLAPGELPADIGTSSRDQCANQEESVR